MKQRVLRLVQEHPGLHLRELTRKIGASLSTTTYYLRSLEEEGLISSIGRTGYKRFFDCESAIYYERTGFSTGDKIIVSFMRQRIPFLIIRFLLIRISAKPMEIATSLGLKPSTLSHHLRKMVEGGVLEKVTKGEDKGYRLVDYERTKDMYLCNRRSYEDEVDEFTDIWIRI